MSFGYLQSQNIISHTKVSDENNKNNSPNGWTDGESCGRLENNSPNRFGWMDRELKKQLENNSSNGWTDVELHGRLENNS